ncbi:MAG: excinuclease ABC subunit UvrA, partial [Chloroflexi bacterium]|nr:excinuclease ABC subunit UvrA [Chloroflexota bacterium]
MPQDKIIVRGAREHNLKDIDVEIPRDKLVVITGLSGSGKSSLAFDTIYAEGQRRYVESLSAYARQFLGQMEKPDVDYIEGLSPAVSIDQKGASRNPRSTVGTVTEIYDYLRLLFARVGHPHCPQCGREISQQSVEQIVDSVEQLPEGSRIMVMAPLVKDRKGEHQQILEDVRKAGYVRVRVDGRIHDIDETIELEKYRKHSIEVVVDRLVIHKQNGHSPEGTSSLLADSQPVVGNPDRTRLADSIETALKLGTGVALVTVEGGEEMLFSEHFACVHCGISLGEIAPRSFSFNSPHGACPACTGLGTTMELDPDLIIPNKSLTLGEGAVQPWSRIGQNTSAYFNQLLEGVARRYGFSTQVPVRDLHAEHLGIILYGNNGELISVRHKSAYGRARQYDTAFEGVVPNLRRRYKETTSDYVRVEIERYMTTRPCPECKGSRLKPESLSVTITGKSIVDVTRMSVKEAVAFFEELWSDRERTNGRSRFSEREQLIARQILKEIRARLRFLMAVGRA